MNNVLIKTLKPYLITPLCGAADYDKGHGGSDDDDDGRCHFVFKKSWCVVVELTLCHRCHRGIQIVR